MINELQVPPFFEWIGPAAINWGIVALALIVAALALGYLFAALRHGPSRAVTVVAGVIRGAFADLARISPRRTLALARLAVKESIRRRIVVGFAIFIVILLFAGWFLDPGSDDPAKLYLSFVLTATGYLVPLLALLISTFSLPNDIRTRTLHTVVTKPVRSSEIVLGRMLGFTVMGTGLLLVMGCLSYVFVARGLSHTHAMSVDDLQAVGQTDADGRRAKAGESSRSQGHRHHVYVGADGRARVDAANGHWHELEPQGDGRYALSAPRGILIARVPVYGKLAFRDRSGVDTTQGISVGDEWTYRSYIEGGSPAAAIWTFTGLSEQNFPDGLPVEMIIGIFRTHKGNIEKGVLGSISLRNPETGLTVEAEIFESKEFATNQFVVPRELTKFASAEMIARKSSGPEGVTVMPAQLDGSLAEKPRYDLFQDLVSSDGRTELWLQCLEPGQYFGAAEPDAYLRAADAPFWVNFIKGYFGIWLQMVLVIGFGVMFSTFLSGPVAMIATLGALMGGYFNDFMYRLATGQTFGGGPLESLIRLVKQQNIMTEMDPSIGATVAKMFDTVAQGGLRVMSMVLPSFGDFSYANYVASGFDVSFSVILVRTITAFSFLVPVFIAGYLCLKNREVAQ